MMTEMFNEGSNSPKPVAVKSLASLILMENDDFIALNKPSGLLTIPDRTQSEKSLKDFLIEKYGSIFTVHRIDRETSGLVLFAKTADAHAYLSQLFEARNVEKYYTGIVHGATEQAGEIAAPIAAHPVKKGSMYVHKSGKESLTTFETIQDTKYFSLLRFRLHTGRTHQIRVHCREIGHPLACDELYGDGKPVYLSQYKKKFNLNKNEIEERPMLNRLALHASELIFQHSTGQNFHLQAPVPKEFKALMTQLSKLG